MRSDMFLWRLLNLLTWMDANGEIKTKIVKRVETADDYGKILVQRFRAETKLRNFTGTNISNKFTIK